MTLTRYPLSTMRARSGFCLATVALLLAILIALSVKPMPVEERLISLQAQEQFGSRSALLQQPLEVQALLLDYRQDELLWLQAQAALHVYPQHGRRLLALFGEEPEFRQALKSHGEKLIPPTIHFYQNAVNSVEVLNRIGGTGAPLTPEQRAWYAINIANQNGADFTGQFLAAPDGSMQWIWTERITEGLSQFFTSGIRGLEARYRSDQEIRARDLGWAAVDAVIIGSAVKFLKAGRAAATTARATTLTARSASYTSRVARAGKMAAAMIGKARWPAAAALAYVVVKHPLVLHDLFAGAASVLGLPAWAVQLTGWFLLFLPLLFLLRWLLRVLAWFIPARRARGLGE